MGLSFFSLGVSFHGEDKGADPEVGNGRLFATKKGLITEHVFHRSVKLFPVFNQGGNILIRDSVGPEQLVNYGGAIRLGLSLFDLYGRGEACRMALAHGKCEWEDNRVTGEAWAAFKASGKCANGQIPVLEVDGKFLNQSEAICRFIGMKTGAYPIADPFACHFADSVINTCSDLEKGQPKTEAGTPIIYKLFGPDVISDKDVAALVEDRKKFHASMENMLGDKTFFGGDKPSIADFWVCALIFSMERNTKGKETQTHVYAAYAAALKESTKLNSWSDKMASELEEYLATRGSGSL